MATPKHVCRRTKKKEWFEQVSCYWHQKYQRYMYVYMCPGCGKRVRV